MCIHDPQMLRWWWPDDWRRRVFEPAGPEPWQHVVILTSDEGDPSPRGEPSLWYHTRGMRKFGRPDLSARGIRARRGWRVVELFERLIGLHALGGTIAEGQEIRMPGLPPGLICRHGGSMDDPDYNNVHVEIGPIG